MARAEREAVRLADGGEDAELDLEHEVANHLADDLGLLSVLLPEVGPLRPNDLEELEDDGCDTSEVARAEATFEDRAELCHLDPGLEPGWVHLLDRGSENGPDPNSRLILT